jgi:hypothetical protein
MKKEMRREATRMLARAAELGLTMKDGKPVVLDLMEELLAAKEGFRNAHAYRAALDSREAPVLVQECPDESGCDFCLVEGRGFWASMGLFSVHPYLTDEGIVIDVYGKKAESEESIASAYAFTADAEEAIAASKGETGAAPDRAQDARSLVLEELGYEIKPDGDQPGLWVWTAPTDSCDSSFSSEEKATEAAWLDALSQVKAVHEITDDEWASLPFEKQRELLLALGED